MSWIEWIEWTLLLVGFAVLHLTWQTLLAGGVIAGLARCGNRVSVRVRYSVALILFLSTPLIALATAGLIGASRHVALVSTSSAQTFSESWPWIASAAQWIGLLWILGAMLGAGRLLGGAIRASRIAKDGHAADAVLNQSTRALIQRLGIRRPTSVRFSEGLQVPSVGGLVAATVLVPPRIYDLLDQDEVDAILAHELSHVRRGDLLTNTAQRVVSALLFFHPVASWISHAIDWDREVCCDDLVTRIGIPRRTYARALARVALNTRVAPSAGLGARSGDVAARVRRLMGPGQVPAKRPVLAPMLALVVPTLLASCIVTRALLPFSIRAARSAPAWEARVLADVSSSYMVNATDPAGEFTISVENGRAVGASIGGSVLALERIRQHGALVTLQTPRPGEAFSVRLLPSGGIEWKPRATPVRN